MPIENDEDFRRLAQMVKDGAVAGPNRDRALSQLREYDAGKQAPKPKAAVVAKPKEEYFPDQSDFTGNIMPAAPPGTGTAAAELAAAGATGALSVIPSGIAGVAGGIAGMFPGGEAPYQKAAKWQEAVEDFISYTPKGEATVEQLKKVGPAAEYVSQKVDDGIYAVTGGVPWLAAGLKTAIYAVPTALGLKAEGAALGSARKATKATKNIDKVLKDTYGVDVHKPDTVPGATADRAKALSPVTEKGKGFDKLLDEVRSAEATANSQKGAAWADFKEKSQGVTVDYTQAKKSLNAKMKDLVERGHAPDDPKLQATIKDLELLGKREKPDGSLKSGPIFVGDLVKLRRRVQTRIGKKPPEGWTPQQEALIEFKAETNNTLRGLLEKEAKKAGEAIAAGKDIDNTAEAARMALKVADEATVKHRKLFKEDKIVRKMLLDGTDAEQAYKMVFGLNALGAKADSVAIIKRLKGVLGPTHPSITDIRKAVVRDIFLPALQDNPDFGKFSRNIRRALDDRAPLLKELGIDTTTLTQMGRMADASTVIAHSPKTKIDKKFVVKAALSVMFNNHLARTSARTAFLQRAAIQKMGIENLTASDLRTILTGSDPVPMIKVDGQGEVLSWLSKTSADASNFDYDEEAQDE